MADTIYTAEATSSGGGRDGKVRSSDGVIEQDVKMPPAMGGQATRGNVDVQLVATV